MGEGNLPEICLSPRIGWRIYIAGDPSSFILAVALPLEHSFTPGGALCNAPSGVPLNGFGKDSIVIWSAMQAKGEPIWTGGKQLKTDSGGLP